MHHMAAPARLLAAALLCAMVASAGAAPISLPQKRPSETPLELPEFEPAETQQPLTLPPRPEVPPAAELSRQARVFIKEIRLSGNTVFSTEELSEITRPYENRVITSGELQAVRYALTLFYIDRGYINSGAIIPDQNVTDGSVNIRIIEGELTSIDVTGNERLRQDYISDRIALRAGPPLNIVRLGEQLQIMQQNPRLERINATLEPGAEPGQSTLHVDIHEAQPYQLWAAVDNHQSPSVGGEQVRLWGLHQNLTGRGDTAQFEFGHAEGLDEWNASYAIPLNARDTTLRLYYDRIDSEVVESPFDDLDIKSDEETISLSLTQPFYLSPSRTFNLGLSLDLRESKNYLLGDPFPFTTGTDNGKIDLTVLRLSQEWLDRGRSQVLAVRSLLSAGVDAFGATVNGEARDGKFVSWLGQLQWARRIGSSSSQVIFRSDAQLANGGLPSMEQFTVGGADTVRGYRENRLVADTGFVASVELRIPVYNSASGNFEVQVAPFVDYGYASSRTSPDLLRNEISSTGIGLLGTLFGRIDFSLYYGHAFQDFDNGEDDIQDDGLSFRLSARLL